MTLPEGLPTAPARRRFVPLAWAGSATAAAVLALGVTGTLSSWTEAIITNDNNTVASTGAVSLKETSSAGTVCVDTADEVDNTATCSDINKYGGTGSPLDPDGDNTQVVTVTLENTGTDDGALTLAADECLSTAAAADNGSNPGTSPLCDEMEVKVECAVTTLGIPGPFVGKYGHLPLGEKTLSDFALDGAQSIATLAADDVQTCRFTLTLPDGTPASYAGQVASQELTWNLTAAA